MVLSTYEDVNDNNDNTFDHATYYSYDQIGNVKSLYHNIKDLGLKKLEYNYDLASGKVNAVRYQDIAPDQFLYQYEYDAENRLTAAKTDVLVTGVDRWTPGSIKTDATYSYLLHGILNRTEIGENKVQGIDYAYTLQGWLKGINSNYLDNAKDLGGDGYTGTGFTTNRKAIARDVFAYTLDYFTNDYKPINNTVNAFPLKWGNGSSSEIGVQLYNGNISHTTIALSAIDNGATTGYSYRYDQLNRLSAMRQHKILTGATSWNIDTKNRTDAFAEDVTYDANGNILTYNRNGNKDVNPGEVAMDRLTYGYQRDNGKLVSNRLRSVTDAITEIGLYTGDYDNSNAPGAYSYDNIGNLIVDDQGNSIKWNVAGKIKHIDLYGGGTIDYYYDVSGNRVYKIYVNKDGKALKTWYTKDATGKTLAVYGNKLTDLNNIYWNEQHLYGSDRLGLWTPYLLLSGSSTASSSSIWSTIGTKSYELSNHLGNVLTIISDKKNGVVDDYRAEVKSAQDYYPFGMEMPGRSVANDYRYGFNAKEIDIEIKGDGNQYNYGFRIYDPRVGRFLSVDPLSKKYVFLTSYQFSGTKPIVAVDEDGQEDHIYTISFFDKQGKASFRSVRNEGNVIGVNKQGYEVYDREEKFVAEYNYTFSDGKSYSLRAYFKSYDDMLKVKESNFYTEAVGLSVYKGIEISDDLWGKVTLIAGAKSLLKNLVGNVYDGALYLAKQSEKAAIKEVEDEASKKLTKETSKSLTEKSASMTKTIVESHEVSKIMGNAEVTLKKNVEKAIEILRSGKAGGNQHTLGGNLTGYKAIDIQGTGNGRGGLRIVYKETENEIILHQIVNYHRGK
ncbi:RHS repeat-associated protein [Chitinophaga skermanii]|uniref:RHS repeat-associated protein n=1 Tax=Chitinophaga skermanii TaxID=331697 RepID=A0A327Q584_9BACT|nr:RHS repeat-associated protein [Chitinophaga skermanii]